ncbi:MAG: LacI family transcriptional regulator, partial [Lentisphaerae bacterium]
MRCNQKQLAEAAGVSQKTVNLALRGKPGVNPKTRERIIRLARDMGYKPHAAARAMVSAKTSQIGIVLPVSHEREFHNPMHFETISGINQRLQLNGYVPCLARLDDFTLNSSGVPRLLREFTVDGYIVLDDVPDVVACALTDLGLPTIWVDSNHWDEQGCLRRDELSVGKMAAQKAVAAGAGNLIFYQYPQPKAEHFSHAERMSGIETIAIAAQCEYRCVSRLQ